MWLIDFQYHSQTAATGYSCVGYAKMAFSILPTYRIFPMAVPTQAINITDSDITSESVTRIPAVIDLKLLSANVHTKG